MAGAHYTLMQAIVNRLLDAAIVPAARVALDGVGMAREYDPPAVTTDPPEDAIYLRPTVSWQPLSQGRPGCQAEHFGSINVGVYAPAGAAPKEHFETVDAVRALYQLASYGGVQANAASPATIDPDPFDSAWARAVVSVPFVAYHQDT